MRIGAIILAAGGSSRMGSPKQLLPYRGRTLIRHAVEQALATSCEHVIVVLGANAGAVAEALAAPQLKITLCSNPHWHEGMGTSIRVGIEAAVAAQLDAVIIALGDQPRIAASHLNTLISTHLETGKPLVASRYAGTAGVPALFSSAHFPELLRLPPAAGCKNLIESLASESALVDCPEAELDIDTPADYARANPQVD